MQTWKDSGQYWHVKIDGNGIDLDISYPPNKDLAVLLLLSTIANALIGIEINTRRNQ